MRIRQHHSQSRSSWFSKMLLSFPPFSGRVENKKSCGSLRLLNIFFNLLPCVWENNELLNKNCWDDIDIIDQGHSKGNVSQFCIYIAAILGPILTDFQQRQRHRGRAIKMTYHPTLKTKVKIAIYRTCSTSATIRPILTKFLLK